MNIWLKVALGALAVLAILAMASAMIEAWQALFFSGGPS